MESSYSSVQSLQLGYTPARNMSLGVAAAILTTLSPLRAEADYRALVYEIESHRTPVAHKDVTIQHPPLSYDILRFGSACALLMLLRKKRT